MALASSGILPMLHVAVREGPEVLARFLLSHLTTTCGCYALGTVFYVLRVLEKQIPEIFDIWVSLPLVSCMKALTKLREWLFLRGIALAPIRVLVGFQNKQGNTRNITIHTSYSKKILLIDRRHSARALYMLTTKDSIPNSAVRTTNMHFTSLFCRCGPWNRRMGHVILII